MDQASLHREEMLEAEIRQLRQCLRNVANAILAGSDQIVPMALRVQLILDGVDDDET